MRFDCGETFEDKERRLGQWHKFFPLLPRCIVSHHCRWLEWIERQGHYADGKWVWRYREAQK